MSFRGELREFELPDILQLIASQQKAGWLKVIWKGNCQFIFFRNGKITSTKNPTDDVDPLETFLLRRGYLSEDQADRVAATRRKTGMDVQDVLQKENIFSADEIGEIFESMVEQCIFELMSIRSGQYEFETEDRPSPVPDGALTAEIGPILMEGARKADEVSEMRRFLGPDGGALVLTPSGRAPDSPAPDEATLLALVNGVRTVDDILDEAGLDTYTGTRGLFSCARKGWVAPVRRLGRGDPDSEVAVQFDPVKAIRWGVPLAAILAFSIALTGKADRYHAPDPLIGEWRNRSARMTVVENERGLRLAVEVYRVKRGAYPRTLEDLLDEGLVRGDAIQDDPGDRWKYTRAGDGASFALAPARRLSLPE